MNNIISRIALLALILSSLNTYAQTGYLDTLFGHTPSEFEFTPNADIAAMGSTIVQPDGKLIVSGIFSTIGNYPSKTIVRLFPNGTVDTSFHSPFEGFNSIGGMALQSDGKIIVFGSLYFLGSVDLPSNSIPLARLNTDGTRDLSFVGAYPNNFISDCHVLSNDKILISGQFTDINGYPSMRIGRLNSNGSYDSSFNSTVGVNNSVEKFTVLTDNKIVMVGGFTSYNGTSYSGIVRINDDGSLDPTFASQGTNLFYEHYFETIVVDQNGKYVVGGRVISFASQYENIYRFNPNGTLDGSFISNGNQYHRLTHSILQPDGKIVFSSTEIAEYDDEPVNNIFRINTNGTIDLSFSATMAFNTAYNISIDHICANTNNEIIVTGSFSQYNNVEKYRIAKLNSEGQLISSFPQSSGFSGKVEQISVQNDDKIVAVGYFGSYEGGGPKNIVRLTTDGEVDPLFDAGTSTNDTIKSCLIQADGKIIIAGNFTSFNGQAVGHICRLNQDGSLDNSFTISANGNITKLHAIPTGGFYMIGNFFQINAFTSSQLARIGANDQVDPSFVSQGFSSGYPTTIDVNSLGELIVGGTYYYYGSYELHRITRINPDGSFNSGAMFLQNLQLTSAPEFLSFVGDDSLLITTGLETIKCSILAEQDPIFQNNFNVNGSHNKISGIVKNEEDQLLITGDFQVEYEPGNSLHLSVLRISRNGTPEYGFMSEHHGDIQSAAMQSSRNLICAGDFEGIQLPIRKQLARVLTCPTVGFDTLTVSGPYTAPDNVTYSDPDNYAVSYVIPNMYGCDSTILLDLTIISCSPTDITSGFSLPSAPDTCIGSIAFDIAGNPDFELIIDGSAPVTSSGYSLVDDLCPGVHDLQIVNFCGDTTAAQFVIPVDSNYVFNNPFIDSLAQDSLGVTLDNCDIYYAGIDTAYIDSIWANGNTVNVIWNIVDSNGSNFDTTSYMLNNGNGVYWLQLSVFCPTKALGDYFTVTEAIYLEGLTVVGLNQEMSNTIVLYPNPTNDLVTITFDGSLAQLTVYDTQGKLIQTSSIVSGTQVSLKDVETGIYFFELSNESGRVVKRVVKK